MPAKKSHRETMRHKQPSDTGIMEQFSPIKLGKIVPTCAKKRQDPFASLQPQKGECLDYDISQTVLRMEAGDTKINIKDVKATYVPAPVVDVKKKKNPREKPPPLKFINEIWLEKQNALQMKYKEDLGNLAKNTKGNKRGRVKKMHDEILSMVGPDWFQELSPSQLRTVDQLECCILTDIKNNTITNLQQNIAMLGLVPRPNHRHIAKALSFCCKSPVEFLLILYQIINPKRVEYSLNDRLLLSAVVHLTMTMTLRELHVRIPSPPLPKRYPTKKQKSEKNFMYPSPYLQPQLFRPEQREKTDYENPRIQYPESPYFAYISSLSMERLITDDIFELDLNGFDEEDAELLEDMRKAQLVYDRIQNGERVKLLRPTILKQCNDASSFFNKVHKEKHKPLVLPPLASLHDSEDEECFCNEDLEDETDTCCERELKTCECEEKCECSKKSKLFTCVKCRGCLARERKKYVQRIIKGITISSDNEVIPIVEGTVLQKTCDCLQTYQDNIVAVKARNNLKCQKSQYVVSGVTMTSKGPVYIISTALKRTKKRVSLNTDLSSRQHKIQIGVEKSPTFQDNTQESDREVDVGESSREMDVEDDKINNVSECSCKPSGTYEKSTVTEESGQSCTCKENGSKQPHTDETDEESSSCDCEACECKERSKQYTGPRCKKCQEKERQKYIQRIITGMKKTASHKLVPIIEGTCLLNSCDCVQTYVERVLSMEARKTIQSQKAQFVVGGVVFTKNGPVYLLSTAVLSETDRICCKPKRKRSRSKERKVCKPITEEDAEEDPKYSGCKCKQELERFLEHKCTCEQCNVKERREEATYVMGGLMSTLNSGTVNMVQGVHEQRCDCLERYREKIENLDQYRKRIEARYNLKSQSLKYSIGGVANTPTGPVYVITGMRPPADCECAKAAKRKEEEDLRLQQMAKMPPTGRIKYQIAGVRQTPAGNVFIISQALAVEDCECVKLYDTYTEAHQACLGAYERFLQQVNTELGEYMAEADVNYACPEQDPTGSDLSDYVDPYVEPAAEEKVQIKSSECSVSHYNLFEKGKVVRAIEVKCAGQKLNICSRGEIASLSDETLIDECACLEEEEVSSESSEESQQCADTCLQDFKRNNPPPKVEEEVVVKEEEEEEKVKLKRFLILLKIPCNTKRQVKIVKRVLTQMAEDGFPLAKLPDSYKLPHFKLWMQLRCGKFWRQKNINSYENFSKKYWAHTDICTLQFTPPNVGIRPKKANELTWKNAHYVKKLVGDKIELFYRDIAEKYVDLAREFFPLTYSYEFPNSTFRDVYFAYMPSKVEDTHAFRIVKPHDTRVIYKKYSCYC